VTRPEEDVRSLGDRLRELGAEAIEAPTIEILPIEDTSILDSALVSVAAGRFSWVVFTSPRAVAAVDERLGAQRLEFPPAQRVAAIGPGTRQRLRDIGITAEFTAEPHTTEALARGFPRGEGMVLLPRADIATEELEEELRTKGWTPVRVDAYRTRTPDRLPAEAAAAIGAGRVDAVCFTSASTVRGFVTMAGVVRGPRVVCIGPVTARAAEESGLRVDAVAEPHTIDGLVAALERLLGGENT
jgi:uroporphyrinogen-III synthase